MTSTTIQDFITRNEQYSQAHNPFPSFQESVTAGYPPPKTAVISCADPRSDPQAFLQLKGDAVVFRSAGAKAENVIESLILVDSLLNFENVMICQHTDCGTTIARDGNIKRSLKELAPSHEKAIDAMHFRDITGTLEESVRNSVDFLKQSPIIRPELKTNIVGFVYDIKTGRLTQV